jgi:hypothetical protein
LERIIDEDRVKEIILFTSIDSFGEQAEYIRHGLDTSRFWGNIDKLLSRLPKLTITIMSTYNLMSPFGYNKLINKVYEIKKQHSNPHRYWQHPILLDTSYLRFPRHQSVGLLYPEHKELILKNAEEALFLGVPIFDNLHMGMTEVETSKIKRIYDWSTSGAPNYDLHEDRRSFVKFVDEHDKRRGTDFLKTFPELEEFYKKHK